jgi:hypothetical protein
MGKNCCCNEAVSIDATQVIIQINKEDLLTEIKDLSQCWETVIRENRDYIEGT